MNTKTFPQPATAHAGENVIFIVSKILDTAESESKIKDLCSDFAGMIRSIQNRFQEAQFCATIAFGAQAWSRLFQNNQFLTNWKHFRK